MMRRFLAAAVVCVVIRTATAQDASNELFKHLVDKGIAIPGGPTVKLPAPLANSGKKPADIINDAAGRYPVDLFIQRTTRAPLNVEISQIENKNGQRCAQKIDLYFVAYGSLQDVLKTDFMRDLFSPAKGKGKDGAKNQSVELSAAQLARRGIKLINQENVKDWYETFSMPLLDKVEVDGITRTVRSQTPSSVTYATIMDDRFRNDKEFPNRWTFLNANAPNAQPQPYSGLGGYVLVTALPEPKEALLVEMHFLMHEPQDWFGERDLLRAKLPIVIRDNVYTFRQKLK
jgi:hypothetical protein